MEPKETRHHSDLPELREHVALGRCNCLCVWTPQVDKRYNRNRVHVDQVNEQTCSHGVHKGCDWIHCDQPWISCWSTTRVCERDHCNCVYESLRHVGMHYNRICDHGVHAGDNGCSQLDNTKSSVDIKYARAKKSSYTQPRIFIRSNNYKKRLTETMNIKENNQHTYIFLRIASHKKLDIPICKHHETFTMAIACDDERQIVPTYSYW